MLPQNSNLPQGFLGMWYGGKLFGMCDTTIAVTPETNNHLVVVYKRGGVQRHLAPSPDDTTIVVRPR